VPPRVRAVAPRRGPRTGHASDDGTPAGPRAPEGGDGSAG